MRWSRATLHPLGTGAGGRSGRAQRVELSSGAAPVVKHALSTSWPGLSRPSTPYLLLLRKEDVDARDKRGHDESNIKRIGITRPAAAIALRWPAPAPRARVAGDPRAIDRSPA